MGNKLTNNRRPERSHPSRVRHNLAQSATTGNSEKISISKIPPAPISMSSTNGKDVEKILKEIDKSPGFKDINKLPRDLSKSDEVNKSIDLIQNKLGEKNSSFDESELSSDTNSKPAKFETSKLTSNANERKRSTARSRSNVEDLNKKRQKLMRQIQKLNQLENEKQMKLLEQQRDMYVEQIKMQDSLIIEESLNNFRSSKDQSFRTFDSKDLSDSDDERLPFTKVNVNHPLVPVYIQETRIPSFKHTDNPPLYANVTTNSGLRNHTSTKSLYDFNNFSSMTNGRERESEYYEFNETQKLDEKELNLILMAIEKFERIEKSKNPNESSASNNSFRQSRYYYKDKQIYPQLDISAVSDPSNLSLIYKSKSQNENLKQLELKKSDKLINDLKMVKDPSKSLQNNNSQQQQSTNSLSQVLKDIIIEYSNMSEEEFNHFKTDLNRDKIARQVAEQQRALEQQKIPKNILDAYRNPYYEHCSNGNSEVYCRQQRSELLTSRSEVNTSFMKQHDTSANEMKRAQSFKACEPVSNLKRARSNLKKLASKKNGEKIEDNEEELYDPTNFLFDEEIKYRI